MRTMRTRTRPRTATTSRSARAPLRLSSGSARLTALALIVALAGCEPGGEGAQGIGVPQPSGDTAQCKPSCHFKQCGDDGCGGNCLPGCGAGLVCKSWQCVSESEADAMSSPADAGGVPSFDAAAAVDAGDPLGPDASIVDPSEDQDGDGVADSKDNCPTVYNPNQSDLDKDFIGDICDLDTDGDGYLDDLDCAPTDHTVSPGAKERCGNTVDDDCDGETDEEGAWDCEDYFLDGDGDGAGTSASLRCLCHADGEWKVQVGGDCDDGDAGFSPLAPEKCDGLDNNCNLLTDEGCDDDGDTFCDAGMEVVGHPDVCPSGGGDCQDYWADVHPGAQDIEGDGLDNDCDGKKAGEQDGPVVAECTGPCTGATVEAFLCALDICYPGYQLGASFSSPTGDSISQAWQAIAHYGSTSNDLAPFAGGSYGIMSSGYWNSSSHQDSLSGFGTATDPYDKSGYTEMNDAVEFKVKLKAPPGVTGFSIDYIYMSAEYHEYVGTMFNDKFYIILKAPTTTGGKNEVINYADCLDPWAYYDKVVDGKKVCYIAINAAFAEPCPGTAANTNLAGTGHECSADGSSTGWLTTSWDIAPDEVFELTFHIHDTSDEIFDSTVLIDAFRWEGGSFQKGTQSHN